MMQKAIKLISLVMASVMVVILFSAAPSTAASKKPKLISSVEMQKYDKATKKWETTSRTEYKYNKKGDPIQIDWTSYTGWGYSTKTIDYHYRKNGKRKYATFKGTGREWDSFGGEYSNYTDKGKITYNKYGHRTKENINIPPNAIMGPEAASTLQISANIRNTCSIWTILILTTMPKPK